MPEIAQILGAMITYYGGNPGRIEHFVKVHDYARTIGLLEGLDKDTLYVLEAAAALLDIGVRICELKYGQYDVKLKEQEGPELARDMLGALGFDENVIKRVCWLVGHHSSYGEINSWEHQILVEADFLVNLREEGACADAIRETYDKYFLTETGRLFCRKLFNL